MVAMISLRSRWARIASACALRIGFGKASNSCGLDQLVLGQPKLLRRVLKDELGDRQHDRELGTGQAAVLLAAAHQFLARGQALDLAVEPPGSFQQLDRPDVARQRLRAAGFRDRQRERLQAVILEHHLRDIVGHLREQRVALLEGEPALAHLAVERDLDVDLIVRAIDACAVVDEVGVDAAAVLGELDAAGLGDAEVGALADHLHPELDRASARSASLAGSPTSA